ncbi:phytoene/squalene synthase family protein [Mongoliimonas terrestris]|uniref:phytoene/squalene synthase family protein n=1 Tax=Mongoliimonas terrestris TaxID=1709001 RepID=UPI0009498627|nr:phytoene/squalene synthase family protein [Mongoliimonas terrestris]
MPTLSADDRAGSEAMLRHGSKSFFAASLLLPRRVRGPATALYAFCRAADDAVDGEGRGPAAAVDALKARLDRIYEGRPRDLLVDRAFASVVEAHAIPRALPDSLIEGFAWDAEGRRYPDLASLEAYALRVAGSVGLMMALVMGCRDEAALARAADLGIAMQYTNIARDVGEDARAGRLYLPADWLAGAGVDPDAFLADPKPSPALFAVVRRLLATADRHYAAARAGIDLLPRPCRPAILAASLVYGDIGTRLRAAGCDPLAGRTVVPKARKAMLIARACAGAFVATRPSHAPAPPAARALVLTVAEAQPPPSPARLGPERLIDILTALETRNRQAANLRPTRMRIAR